MLDDDEPEWIIEHAKARKRREMLRHREDMEERLKKIRAKEKTQRDKYLKADKNYSKKRRVDVARADDYDNEEEYVLEDYDSDGGQSKSKLSTGGLSAETLELLRKVGMGSDETEEEDGEAEDEIKVFEFQSYAATFLTITDLLLFKDPLATHTIHQ